MPAWLQFRRLAVAGLCLIGTLSGCRTAAPLPPADLAQPGWTISRGQGVWQRGNNLDIAGELLVAVSEDRTLVQFSKGPLQVATARTESGTWEFLMPFQNKRYSGHGRPPRSLGWFLLAPALSGGGVPRGWTWSRTENNWKLESASEVIAGTLSQ